MSRVQSMQQNEIQNKTSKISPGKDQTKKKFWVVLLGLGMSLIMCVWIATLASKEIQPTSNVLPKVPATQTTAPTYQAPQLPTVTLTIHPSSFTDHFDRGLSNYWAYFVSLGKKKDVDFSAQGEHLRITITGYNTYAYLIHEGQTYKNVRVDTEVTNQGNNNNNVGLVCRFSKNGWYEFNISSSGVYNIYAYDNKEYRLIRNGGSQKIHMNKATNQYSVECNENELTLYINGEKIWSGKDSTFREGKIGLSATTKDYQPIKIDFEWIKVTKQ